jgi:hypothetical protein
MQILVPRLIPLNVIVKNRPMRDLTDYMNRQVSFNPYNKGQTAQYGQPYQGCGDYAGINTDIRYYDLYNPEHGMGGRGTWLS